jgi:hypothetical protein
MTLGLNVDPFNSDNAPSVDQLQRCGARWVRLVSRPGVEDYVSACHAADIMVLAVVTQQSEGYLCPAEFFQIGNEPDVPGTGDTMSAASYVEYWNLYRNTYPDVPMIGAGLGSGQAAYWRSVQSAGGLHGAAGFGVHPYAKDATGARALLRQYQNITPNLSLWITEMNRPSGELPEFTTMLRTLPVVMWAWFCWSPSVARGAGIYPLDDSTRRVLGAVA